MSAGVFWLLVSVAATPAWLGPALLGAGLAGAAAVWRLT